MSRRVTLGCRVCGTRVTLTNQGGRSAAEEKRRFDAKHGANCTFKAQAREEAQ